MQRRSVRASSALLCALGAILIGCTVYDSELVISNGGLTGGGSKTTGGSKSEAGSGLSGTSGTDGGKGSTAEAGSSGSGGTKLEPEGGAPTEGGEGSGGHAGIGGAAGNGGSASQGGGAGANAGTSGSAGNGGSGGTAPLAKCSDHALTEKPTWKATASSESLGSGTEADGLYNPAVHMTDGSYTERWSSGKTQVGDEWIQIDFGALVNLTGLTLNVNSDAGDYPRAYELRVSNTSEDFAAVVRASGEGMPGNTVMTFPMLTARYVTVRQTGMNTETAAWWTIAEVFAVCIGP
ncbi:MAG: coagulation factor 5/8 type domain protein [Polyangiaceae bacterium]|nr:coagulation factor 5/8 type domain protein [Polyangiaceae bacterium]